jgi:AraC-like DNA-binding protein
VVTCDGQAEQLGQEVMVAGGDAVVLSNSDPGSFIYRSAQSALALALPRASLGPLLGDIDAAMVRTIPKDNAAFRLLMTYVTAMGREPGPASEDLQRLAAEHVHDLVALALGATRDAAEVARSRGVRTARLHAAKTFVMRHLGRYGLSAVTVAAHLGVTPRYVHMLFEASGLSFSEFVVAERLARAHRMLSALRHAGERISTIAYAAGFADLSHFNRAFRRRYGCTPSDVRASARIERHRGSDKGDPT